MCIINSKNTLTDSADQESLSPELKIRQPSAAPIRIGRKPAALELPVRGVPTWMKMIVFIMLLFLACLIFLGMEPDFENPALPH